MDIYIIFFIIVILIWIFLILKYTKKTWISKEKVKFFNSHLIRIVANGSSKEQIIDIDKLYHKILLENGYAGTFWEILKKKPKEVWDLNKIWELHKLRNKLVHDFDILSETILKKKSLEYQKKIKILLQNCR